MKVSPHSLDAKILFLISFMAQLFKLCVCLGFNITFNMEKGHMGSMGNFMDRTNQYIHLVKVLY